MFFISLPKASLDRHNVDIWIRGAVGNLRNEHFVSIIMPGLTKEPGCMHVETPGSSGAISEDTKLILLSSVDSVKVPHEHIVNMLCCRILGATIRKNYANLMELILLHDAAIQHAAEVATLRAGGVGANPLILQVNHWLDPNARVGTSWARINGAVLNLDL